MDRAGWHTAKDLAIPANLTPCSCRPTSRELNAIEWVWVYLRERFLSSSRIVSGRATTISSMPAALPETRRSPNLAASARCALRLDNGQFLVGLVLELDSEFAEFAKDIGAYAFDMRKHCVSGLLRISALYGPEDGHVLVVVEGRIGALDQ